MINNLHQLEKKIANTWRQSNVPGLAVALIRDAQLVAAYEFGNLDTSRQVAVASLSKPIFAYLVLLLVEKGILDFDTPLNSNLLEPYILGEIYLKLITCRHTISHTSGFPNWRSESGLHIVFPPGSSFMYSTEGLIYLQTVIEYLLQKPMEKIIEEELFVPLGMQNSHLIPEDLSSFLPFLPGGLRCYAAISLQTTILDYARFVIHMMETGDNAGIHLGQSGVDTMLTPSIQVGRQVGLSWGLGWGLQHISGMGEYFWHWGARRDQFRGYATGSRRNRSGVVIFTNDVNGLTLCESIAGLCLGSQELLPSFKWLLPAETWRGDGM